MLHVTNLKVFSVELDHLDMSWEIENTTEDPWDYTFTMERSESALGPWDTVSPAFTDKYLFRDVDVNLLHRWRKFFYRIKVTAKSDSSTWDSEPAALGAKPDLIALEVRRQELVLMREYIGRRCWIFPRRTFGQRCTCYDPVSGHSIGSQCLDCFDTTYVRGYLDPIEMYVQFDPSSKHTQQLQIGETQQDNTTARLIDFPPLKPKDIIVEAENRRWRVAQVNTTERLRATLHQEIVVHAVPLSDIEFKLPIHIADLEAMQPSPERAFTNPHNLEGHKDEEFFEAAVAVYGYRGRSGH